MSFSKLPLSSSLLNALYKLSYTKPYPIQTKVIPELIDKKDILAIAKTGSGKTASYVLPIIHNIQSDNTESSNRHIKSLVLVPTRELAIQVEEVFKSFSSQIPDRIKTLAVYGGVSINPQMMALQNVDILVATPGRLIELVEANAVKLQSCSTLVLDEADKLLNRDFKEELNKILSFLPRERQNLLFSATLSDKIEEIKQIILKKPIIINLLDEEDNFANIKQTAYLVSDDKKGPLLRHLIKHKEMNQVMVFASSTFNVDKIANKLIKNGINAEAVHSKKSQSVRKEVLKRFKAKELTVIVTTDLLSRGIDIDFLPFVINYELPRSPKDYIHRIGRTGRAEASGEAISLISPEEEKFFRVIQKKMKKWVDTIDASNLNEI